MYELKTVYALAQGELVVATDALGPTNRRYWPVAARWAHVLRLFPLVAGWRTEVTHEDSAIVLLEGAKSVLFTASLYSPAGHRAATATALVPIIENKDWEAGETNARGNLAKALGFPADIEELIGVVAAPLGGTAASDESAIVPVAGAPTEQRRAPPAMRLVTTAAAEAAPAIDAPSLEDAAAPIQPTPAMAPAVFEPAPGGGLDMLVINQIAAIHATRGLGPIPTFSTNEDARTYLKQVRKNPKVVA